MRDILETGKGVIQSEINGLQKMMEAMDGAFTEAVQEMASTKGRIILTGVGKSGLIAHKISATFNSTGTPALYMHAGDAIHGDLGMIQKEDISLVLSKSGESPEIKYLLPFLKTRGAKIIALCGKKDSYLVKNSDFFLDTSVSEEADGYDLAPTTSTTAQLAMGDALAIALLHQRGFSPRDFAKFHPGGTLGKRLLLKVRDLSKENKKPAVEARADLKAIIITISENMLGATAVLKNDRLIGIITDGDLRRMLESEKRNNSITAEELCSKNPKTIEGENLAIEALELMKDNAITQIIVTEKGKYNGMIHIHNLIKNGLF